MSSPLASRVSTSRSTRGGILKQYHPRTKGPSAESWERLKPFIMRYYIEEKMSQDEILDLLSKKHGHNAKLNMLKTRLKQWDMKKNYTKAEKQAAARELKRCADLGLNPPVEMKIDGRHPSWDRVYRQCRNDADFTSPWLRKNTEWRALVSRICLKTSSTDHFLEVTLRQVSTYWGTVLVEQERRLGTKRQEPHALRIGFLSALRLLNKGHDKQGWREIHDTCGKVINIFRSREPDLLVELISLFSARTWVIHPQLFFAVAKYLLSASRDLVGPEHPLSHILSAFVALLAENNQEPLSFVPELALKAMLDLAEKEREKVKLESFYIHSLEAILITKISQRLGHHAVRQLVQTKFSHYRATLGERNMHTLSMLLDLAEIHMFEARVLNPREKRHEIEAAERKAEKILLKVVRQGEKYPDDLYRVGGYLVAAQHLARLYFAKQDFQSAHKYYRLAVVWSAQRMGRSHSFTSLLLNEYKALEKLAELGLVDIKPEEEDRQTCNPESQRVQDFQGADPQGAQSSDVGDCAELTSVHGEGSSLGVVGYALPPASTRGWEDISERSALPIDPVSGQQGSRASSVQTPNVSQSLTAGIECDGAATTFTRDPPIFFEEDLTAANLQMDDIDHFLG